MIYMGIDPGLSGGIAVLNPENRYKEVVKMPPGKGYPEPLLVYNELKRLINGQQFCVAIEQTSTRPGQGIAAAHNYGIGFGILLGQLYSLRPVEIRTIRPQVWQKDIWGLFGSHGEDSKQKTYQSMLRAHPEISAKLTTIQGKLLDGNSDALAIATWIQSKVFSERGILL